MSISVGSEVKQYADRHEELKRVLATAEDNSVFKLLVLHGSPRVGKSLLLKHAFLGSKDLGVKRIAFVDCEQSDGVADLIDSICEQLNSPFPRTKEAQRATHLLEVNRNRVKGNVNIAVHFQDLASLARDQEDRLLRAFRDDLKELAARETVVLFVDHLDRATSCVDRLLLHHLLPSISGLNTLRMIVASRTGLQKGGLWESLACYFELSFVRDAKEWADYFRTARNLEVPIDAIEILIRVCKEDGDIFLALIGQYCNGAPERHTNAF
jgi:hypothetical protein